MDNRVVRYLQQLRKGWRHVSISSISTLSFTFILILPYFLLFSHLLALLFFSPCFWETIQKWPTFVIQSTLVILKSNGLTEKLRDIRTSTYQIFRIEEKNQTATFHKRICNWTTEVIHILKILWKRGEIAPYEQFLLFSTKCYLLLGFHVKTGTRFSLRDKRLFEISVVELTNVDCILYRCHTCYVLFCIFM